MRLPRSQYSTPVLLMLPLMSAATVLNCDKVIADGHPFDLSTLGGPHVISLVEKAWRDDITRNSTFTIDICSSLRRHKDIPREEECDEGTRICNVARYYGKDGKLIDEFSKTYPIAGQYTLRNGRKLDPRYTRLKTSDSTDDSKKEGVRIELNGGHGAEKPQKAYIEFLCDPNRTGLEGDKVDDRTPVDGGDGDDSTRIMERDDERSLTVESYKDEEQAGTGKTVGVLRMRWRTEAACENRKRETGEKGARWGFFTWFIIILFLALSAYLIFGSWLNYSRYGARGWDLLPHGDAIRDIPYHVKDFGRKVVNAVQGPGSRGGYSAV